MSDNIDIFPFQVVFSIILDLYWQHISCTPDLLLRMSTADRRQQPRVYHNRTKTLSCCGIRLMKTAKTGIKSIMLGRSQMLLLKQNQANLKKVRKLIGQFTREQKKVFATGKSAQDGQKWIYFKPLLFLKDKNVSRTVIQFRLKLCIISSLKDEIGQMEADSNDELYVQSANQFLQ